MMDRYNRVLEPLESEGPRLHALLARLTRREDVTGGPMRSLAMAGFHGQESHPQGLPALRLPPGQASTGIGSQTERRTAPGRVSPGGRTMPSFVFSATR